MTSRTFAGARARFKIDGNKVAYAGGCSGEESIDLEPIDVLDMVEVLEHVAVAYRCSLNANVFRVVGASLKNMGIFPLNENILTQGTLEAAVEDSITRRTAYLFQGVKAATKGFDLSARSVVTENISFMCIRVLDEASL